MSTNAQTNDKRLRLSTENWRIIKGLIIGRAKATKVTGANGDRCFKSLTTDMVTIPEYWALNAAGRQRHSDDDSALLAAIVETLHLDDVSFTTEFSSNLVLDDNTVPNYAGPDPNTPAFCFSPGRGAYNYLESEFGHGDLSTSDDRYNDLMAVNITEHRGDLDAFAKDFNLARTAYRTAALSDGRSLRDLEATLHGHLISHFQTNDGEFYDNVLSRLRHEPLPANKTSSAAIMMLKKEYKGKKGHLRVKIGNKVTALQVDTGPNEEKTPTDLQLLRDTITVLTSQVADLKGGGQRKKPNNTKGRSKEDEALFQKCFANGTCYLFLKGKCKRPNCKYNHPANHSATATVVDVELLVVDTTEFDAPGSPPPERKTPEDPDYEEPPGVPVSSSSQARTATANTSTALSDVDEERRAAEKTPEDFEHGETPERKTPEDFDPYSLTIDHEEPLSSVPVSSSSRQARIAAANISAVITDVAERRRAQIRRGAADDDMRAYVRAHNAAMERMLVEGARQDIIDQDTFRSRLRRTPERDAHRYAHASHVRENPLPPGPTTDEVDDAFRPAYELRSRQRRQRKRRATEALGDNVALVTDIDANKDDPPEESKIIERPASPGPFCECGHPSTSDGYSFRYCSECGDNKREEEYESNRTLTLKPPVITGEQQVRLTESILNKWLDTQVAQSKQEEQDQDLHDKQEELHRHLLEEQRAFSASFTRSMLAPRGHHICLTASTSVYDDTHPGATAKKRSAAAAERVRTLPANTPVGSLLVMDTGANGIVLGGGGLALAQSSFSVFTPTPSKTLSSNGHSDKVIGSGTLTVKLSGHQSPPILVTLDNVLATPTSKWNVAPPSHLPGFVSAEIARNGAMTIHLQGCEPITTRSFHGLQVLQFTPVPSDDASASASAFASAHVALALESSLSVSPPPPPALIRLAARAARSHGGLHHP